MTEKPSLNFQKLRKVGTDTPTNGPESSSGSTPPVEDAHSTVGKRRAPGPAVDTPREVEDAFNPYLDEDDDEEASSQDGQEGGESQQVSVEKPSQTVSTTVENEPPATPASTRAETSKKVKEVKQSPPVKAVSVKKTSQRRSATPVEDKQTSRSYSRGSRFKMRDDYVAVLHWIEKARYTNAEQVSVFIDSDTDKARKLLEKLERYGYLARKQFVGYPLAFHLTPIGKDVVESDTRAVDEASGPQFIKHTLAVGWVMLGLLKSKVKFDGLELLGRPVELDDFITEPELVRATNQEFGQHMDRLERFAQQSGRNTFVKKWEGWKAVATAALSASRDLESTGEYLPMWAVFNEDKMKPHFPDLILVLPRTPDTDVPQSVAFEIERSLKPKSVEDILLSYDGSLGQNNPDNLEARYRRCVWVCGNEKVSALVQSKVRGQFGGHMTQLESDWLKWKVKHFEQLDARIAKSRAEHRAARERNEWHITAAGVVSQCRCGVECRARFGRYLTQEEALETLQELV